MKRHALLLITTTLMAMIAKAQKGEIIYTDFEPDLVKTFYYYNVSQHVFHTDLDNDGIVDFYFH